MLELCCCKSTNRFYIDLVTAENISGICDWYLTLVFFYQYPRDTLAQSPRDTVAQTPRHTAAQSSSDTVDQTRRVTTA